MKFIKEIIVFLMVFLVANTANAQFFGGPFGDPSGPDASKIKTDVSNFGTNLSSVDTDVQKALETLDDLSAVGGGDSVSIDSSAVVDPDFVSTGDIDFIDTSNTVTANINTSAVQDAEMDYTAVTLSDFTDDVGFIDGSGTANYIPKFSDSDTVTDSVIYDDGTNLGLGTITPSVDLHIYRNNTATTSSMLIDQAGSGDASLNFRLLGAQSWFLGIDNSDSNTFKIGESSGFASNVHFAVDTSGNVGIGDDSPDASLELVELSKHPFMISNGASGDGDILTVTLSGNVGVGSPIPEEALVVTHNNGTTSAIFNRTGTGGNVIEVKNNDGSMYFGLAGSLEPFIISDGAVLSRDYFVVAQGGNVGMNEDSPDAVLEISEEGIVPFMISNGDAGDGDYFIIKNGGNVGIGDVTPSELLNVGTGNSSEALGASSVYITNDLEVDGTIYGDLQGDTDVKCFWLENPTATDDLQSVWISNGFTKTISKIWCESDQTVNLDLQVDDGTPADVNGTDLVCDSTPAEDESLSGDTSMADGDRLDIAITSVSGSPTWVSVCATLD